MYNEEAELPAVELVASDLQSSKSWIGQTLE